MKKHCCVYQDKDIERFNHVTKVKGIVKLKSRVAEELKDDFDRLYNELHFELYDFGTYQEAIGISKCSPEDKYNEKAGLIIASRKAELKGNKAILRNITEYRKQIEKYLELVKDIEDKLDYKVGKLELYLAVMNNRGE